MATKDEPNVKHFVKHGDALDFAAYLEAKGYETEINTVNNPDIGGYVVLWW